MHRRIHTQQQGQTEKQRLAEDVGNSYEMFFRMMSSFEFLIEHIVKPSSGIYFRRLFDTFARADYREKSVADMAAHLKTQIMIFKNAIQVMSMAHPGFAWKLPVNFPPELAKILVKNYMKLLREQRNSSSALKLAKEIQTIIKELEEPL